MKKIVKLLALITLFFSDPGYSQLRIKAPDGFVSDLKKIIVSFPDHFINYRGEVIIKEVQSTDFACTMKVNGAEESKITNYSGKKEIWSWQALMLTTESFDEAKQKFRSLFNQLNDISVDGNLRLKGNYESPRMENKFTSVIFEPKAANTGWEKIRVELLLEFFAPMEWRLLVYVYDRDREDNEEAKRER